jgi:hypothetical protein
MTCRSWDIWVSEECLLWWAKGRNLPPLVTTSPPGTPRQVGGVPVAGALGQPTTSILFGGEVGDEVQSGGRLDLGAWLDRSRMIGLGGKLLILNGDSARFIADSPDGSTTLARPFYNALGGFEDAYLAAFIDPVTGPFSAGRVDVESTSDILGAESYLRVLAHRGCGFRIDLVGGYQFNRIDDGLTADTFSVALDPSGIFPVGTTIAINDVFDVHNEFHGGQVGLLGDFHYRCWTLKTLVKMGVGNMRETVTIRGSNTITLPGGSPITNPGGLLAQDTNMGTHQRDETAIVPAVDVALACQITSRTSLSIGYSCIYWNRVAMAGDQVDRAIGGDRPAFAFHGTDFWTQGVNFGAQFSF